MLEEQKTLSENMCLSRLGLDPGSSGDPSSHNSMNNLHFQDGSWSYHLPSHRAAKANMFAAKMTFNSLQTMPVHFTLGKDFLKFKDGIPLSDRGRSKTWEIVLKKSH